MGEGSCWDEKRAHIWGTKLVVVFWIHKLKFLDAEKLGIGEQTVKLQENCPFLALHEDDTLIVVINDDIYLIELVMMSII